MKFRAISGAAHPPTQSADAPSKASDQNAVLGHRQCDRNTDKIHSQLQATASSKNNETGADPTCIAMRSVCSGSAESFEEVSLSDEEHKEDVTPQQALAKAIYNGDTGFVRAALKHDSSISNQSLPVANTNGTAPALYQAALTGHADIVRELLAAGADATTKLSHDLATPLHIAAYLGHRAATKVLLEHARKATDQTGIINAATKDGATPLFFAAEQCHHEIVAELINAGANPKASVGNHKPNGNLTPLHIAAEKGNLEFIKALLDSEFKNFPIDTRCSQNATPLHWAPQSEHTDVVSYLLKLRSRQLSQPVQGCFQPSQIYFCPEPKVVQL